MPDQDLNLPPPARRNHLTPFTEGPRAWLVLARNAIPVLGVYLLGWSPSLIIFQIWFDGVTALGAMLAFQIRTFAKHDKNIFEVPEGIPPSALPLVVNLIWLIIFLLLGIPYWFTLLFFGFMVFNDGSLILQMGDFGIIAAFLFIALSNTLEESRRGYEHMSDAEIRLEFNWDFSMHLARIAAMLLVTFFIRLGLIIGVALALSYVEIYPMRTLRFLGGDSTLDAENEKRSQD